LRERISCSIFLWPTKPNRNNPMENIVGDSFSLLGINWWRKHHRRKDGGGFEPINNWSKPQLSSKLYIGILRYLAHILCTFLFLSLGGEFRKVDSVGRGFTGRAPQNFVLYGRRKPLFAQIVLHRFCTEHKVDAKLYFCADFTHFIFFVGIHIPLIEFPVQSHLVNYQLSLRAPIQQTNNYYWPRDSITLSFLPLW
jgi:hypothetical protein